MGAGLRRLARVSVVVDASVIVALLVANQRQAGAQAHLERWVDSGEELHAPAVLPYEVAKVVARLVFDGNLQANSVAETWSDLAALGASFQPFDLAEDGPAGATIATQLRRRHATGSTYIHLAQQLGTHVQALDGALARNGADLGLPSSWSPELLWLWASESQPVPLRAHLPLGQVSQPSPTAASITCLRRPESQPFTRSRSKCSGSKLPPHHSR